MVNSYIHGTALVFRRLFDDGCIEDLAQAVDFLKMQRSDWGTIAAIGLGMGTNLLVRQSSGLCLLLSQQFAATRTVMQRSACKMDFFLLGSGTRGATVFGLGAFLLVKEKQGEVLLPTRSG
jgi:hypothetical protein